MGPAGVADVPAARGDAAAAEVDADAADAEPLPNNMPSPAPGARFTRGGLLSASLMQQRNSRNVRRLGHRLQERIDIRQLLVGQHFRGVRRH